jgi:hypothetical protein
VANRAVTMLETTTLVGAIVGLVTGAFIIWYRWVRGRPLAQVAIKTLGANPCTYICIRNPGHDDVLVLGVRAYPPGIYGVAKNHSLAATLSAAFNLDVHVLLQRDADYDLPIFMFPKNIGSQDRDLPSRTVCFLVFWCKPSSSWFKQVPILIMTSTRALDRMAAAAIDSAHAEQAITPALQIGSPRA